MARFILLLHESPTALEGLSPEEIQKLIDEYSAWRVKIAEAGHLAGGEKLEDGTARVLTARGEEVEVTDGPYAEAKEVIGGFFMIHASDWDEAVELCMDCPHLRYGERIELRKIDEIH